MTDRNAYMRQRYAQRKELGLAESRRRSDARRYSPAVRERMVTQARERRHRLRRELAGLERWFVETYLL